MVDTVSGETVSYLYDSLKRLTSASSTAISGGTPAAWTQTFNYDGFGNLTAKSLNGTTTPIAVTAATNRLAYSSYDANGNMLTGVGATLTYDERNRLATATPMSGGTAYYGYAPDNKRIYQKTATGIEEWCVYDPRGERVGTFSVVTSGYYPYLTPGLVVAQTNVWFAGRLVNRYSVATYTTNAVLRDRLGSDRSSGERYYPYGDEITSTANDTDKFGTFYRDSFTTLDYAEQRYYASSYGRFNTADQYMASAGPSDPGSWNRYAYVGGDPINGVDPQGLIEYDAEQCLDDPESCEGDDWGGGGDGPVYDSGDEGAPSICFTNPTWALWHANACGMSSGASTQGGSLQKIINITNFSTTSTQALAVQSELRFIQDNIGSYATCNSWLAGNNAVIGTILGQGPYPAVALVGVGTFSSSTINAVSGNVGTNLPDGTALITVNSNGGYFNSSAGVGVGVSEVNAGSPRAQLLILLHELAHLTQARFSNG